MKKVVIDCSKTDQTNLINIYTKDLSDLDARYSEIDMAAPVVEHLPEEEGANLLEIHAINVGKINSKYQEMRTEIQQKLDEAQQKHEEFLNRTQIVEMSPEEEAALVAKDKTIEELCQSAGDGVVAERWPDKGALALDMLTRGKEVVEAEMQQLREEATAKVIAIEEAALAKKNSEVK